MRIVGLFAGIGGIEEGFRVALADRAETTLFCESWEPAQRVLRDRFPGVPLHADVRRLDELPPGTDVVAAGFPCTDLSQAGRTAGIRGSESGLVSNVFRLLDGVRGRKPSWLVIENVPNMLTLDHGEAMQVVVGALEDRGWRWAYRVVDSRAIGVPQRRRRVIVVASADLDPCAVLFADDAGEPTPTRYRDDAFGFYWTEGRGGLGWAKDAVPTLKGGSTIGIASPPAVWFPLAAPGRKLVVPSIEEAERLQGFPAGWTSAAATSTRNGPRWKLVGNAVTVGVAAWLAGRIESPGDPTLDRTPFSSRRWPTAAYGDGGKRYSVAISEYPLHARYTHLAEVIDSEGSMALSERATLGFWNRLGEGNLGRYPGFRESIHEHLTQFGAPVAARAEEIDSRCSVKLS